MSVCRKGRKSSLLVYGLIFLPLLCWLITLLFLLRGLAISSVVANPSLREDSIGNRILDHQDVPRVSYIRLEGVDSEGNASLVAPALMTSKFCLCARGNKGWSLVVMDALWFGCVPVFLADHYQPPLNGLIHWDDISIAVPEHQVGSLKKILQNISDHKLANMQENIARVYHHLTWHDPPRPYDAFHGILFQLWQRRHIHRSKPYPFPDIINL